MIEHDRYRKPVKEKPRLFIIKWVDTDSDDDDIYYVQIEGDDTYLTTDAPKATVFSYAQAEIFRFRWGKNNLKMVPRYSEVKRYIPPSMKVEVNRFWIKSLEGVKTTEQTEQTVYSVCDIEPKIETKMPAIFKKKEEPKETIKKFWQ